MQKTKEFVQIREVLKQAVSGFTPQCCVKDLLSEHNEVLSSVS